MPKKTKITDLYTVLGVPRTADEDAIKTAYRKKALQYHPDVNKAPDAQQRFIEATAAYDILKDSKKRAQYDGGVMEPEDFDTAIRKVKVEPYEYYQYSEMFGGDTAWGKDSKSKEAVFYLFVPKRQETAAREALEKMGLTKKKFGLALKDIEVNGNPFVAIGFTNHFLGMGDIMEFENTWGGQPRFAKVQGERETCLADFIATPQIQKYFADVEKQSTFRSIFDKVVDAMRVLYERNKWGSVNDPFLGRDYYNITETRSHDIRITKIYDKELPNGILTALRAVGMKAETDFHREGSDRPWRDQQPDIIIHHQTLAKHPELADALLDYARNPERKSLGSSSRALPDGESSIGSSRIKQLPPGKQER